MGTRIRAIFVRGASAPSIVAIDAPSMSATFSTYFACSPSAFPKYVPDGAVFRIVATYDTVKYPRIVGSVNIASLREETNNQFETSVFDYFDAGESTTDRNEQFFVEI